MLTPTLRAAFPKLEGSLFVIICSYRGGVGNSSPFSFSSAVPKLGRLSKIIDKLTLLNLREFIATNRDFFANPRSLDYQLSLVEDLLRKISASRVNIALDKVFAAESTRESFASLGDLQILNSTEMLNKEYSADFVVLIYPDALGLGWDKLEGRLLDKTTYILNGRRRIQFLDAAAHRRLCWHRFIASTRLPELIMSAVIAPLSGLLAAWDKFRDKS